ncbi:MAG: glycosyltransferase family 4 protein [Nocardioidaceae bacterium]
MGRILVVTNDFPPRRGGIESFVASLCAGLPAADLVVYTAQMPGSAQVDGAAPYAVVRDRSGTLLPTRRVAGDVQQVARAFDCDRAVFGAAAPLGLLARGLRDEAGVRRVVAISHGHEVWWSKTPAARQLLRRVASDVDVLTYVSQYCQRELARALPPAVSARMVQMAPGVDTEWFRPGLDGSDLRHRVGIGPGRPVVLAASRLVARKGQDVLIRAWPRVVAAHPDAVLVIVGDGPARVHLHRLVSRLGLSGSVRFAPSVDWAEMPRMYAAADVFALPCRTRLWGLEPEALGIVYLEAAAAGLPVVVGDSGGAPETVADGETGYVVDARDPAQVAARIAGLLASPRLAAEMGRRGRQRVTDAFGVDQPSRTLARLLQTDG